MQHPFIFSIDEFSCVTQLKPQLLAWLQTNDLLIPDRITGETDRQGYSETLIHTGRLFNQLLSNGFSDTQMHRLMPHIRQSHDCYTTLKHQFSEAAASLNDPEYARRLDEILIHEFDIRERIARQNPAVTANAHPPGWIATIRFMGKESDIALCAGILQRKLKGNLTGAPFAMFHTLPNTAETLDIEVCVPVSQPVKLEAISVRQMDAGSFYAVTVQDGQELLPRVYEMLIRHCHSHKITWQLPVWAVYVKGFPAYGQDKPNKSITEIRFF